MHNKSNHGFYEKEIDCEKCYDNYAFDLAENNIWTTINKVFILFFTIIVVLYVF